MSRSLLIAVIGVLTLVIILQYTHAQPAIDATAAEVTKLRKERIETLRQAAQSAQELYAHGTLDFGEVIRLNQALLDAELASATARERVDLLKKAVELAKQQEQLAATRFQAGMANQLGVLEAKAHRLAVEIQLAQVGK
jgi:outer membrane protein TolC